MTDQSINETATHAPTRERLEFTIPSVIERMHDVLNELTEKLEARGLVQPHSHLFVALDEAIANAIKHGNKSDPTKNVHITAEIDDDEVTFVITDEGEGFDLANLPDPTDSQYLMRPCGRGVMLIYHLMDDVEYNERGNQVKMKKKAEKQ
jgi:serine/threonine-protein kinase RsbW